MGDDLATRYYLELACAFVRGRLPEAPPLSAPELLEYGKSAGLSLHKFKRSSILPRVKRVFGYLYQLPPDSLLDVGSGRGVFLWPLLDTFPDLAVHCVDVREDRVRDINAVQAGGVARLSASVADVTDLPFEDGTFAGVTLLEVLEHLEQPGKAVVEAVRVARDFVIISVPSKPDDNPEHIHLFTGEALVDLFSHAGIEQLKVDYVLNHIVALAMIPRS